MLEVSVISFFSLHRGFLTSWHSPSVQMKSFIVQTIDTPIRSQKFFVSDDVSLQDTTKDRQ